jgi:osmotically-inducible protein OsmY
MNNPNSTAKQNVVDTAAAQGFPAKNPPMEWRPSKSTKEAIMNNDHKLKTDILAELSWEPGISADHIGVTAKDGVVTLSGHVDSYWQKHVAEAAAGRVQGVKAIAEEIEVRLPLHCKRSDEEIAAAALSRLAWDTSVPKDTVKVKVEKGFVTLTGQVLWHFQKESARQSIRSMSGVTGVDDQTTLALRPNTEKISDDIIHALNRSWYFVDSDIKVTADGGKVRLSGTVDSWSDRQTAASTAWAAPGATSVVNDLTVV